jgi:TetR/AcrR family transcriptional regulator
MSRPRKGTNVDTRGRILRAGIDEFARHGFNASGVDRIARKARVNKSLIYYYFRSKLGLYHAVLHASIDGLVAALTPIVEGPASAEAKLTRYVDGLVGFLEAHPHLPPIMLREMADGGRHLDLPTLKRMLEIPPLLFRLVSQGRAEKTFAAFDPLMLHFLLMGTTLIMASNMPIRRRIRQLGLAEPPVDTATTTAALQSIARRVLRKDHSDVA